MSQQANTKLIGIFVIGAVVAGFFSLILLHGGSWFSSKNKYVLYFERPVDGLQTGADVLFRGVPVGSVTDIRVIVDENSKNPILTPVVIEIDPYKISREGNTTRADQKIKYLVEHQGLRATLEKQSYLTGLLQITFDYYPGTQIQFHKRFDDLDELPTTPSAIDQLTVLASKLAKLDLEQIVNDFHASIIAFKNLAASPDLSNSLKNLNLTLIDLRKVASELDTSVGPTMNSIRTAADATRTTAKNAQVTFASMQSLVDEDSPTRVDLEAALKDLSQAARSIRQLSDNLEQDPTAILRGKSKSRNLP